MQRALDEKPYDLATGEHDFLAWQGLPRRSILICTHPRSGSTLLGEALYFAGGLGCPLEYLHVGFRPAFAQRWGTTALEDYVQALHRHRTDPAGTFSIKLFWRDIVELANELDPGAFAQFVSTPPERLAPGTYRAIMAALAPFFPDPVFVHLSRRDSVRQAVSGVIATETNLWRSLPDAAGAPIREPAFDFDRIEQLIGYGEFCHRHWRNLFAATGVTPFALTYEDLVGDYAPRMRGLLDHLGSTASPPPARTRRQADSRSEAFVLRFLMEAARRRA